MVEPYSEHLGATRPKLRGWVEGATSCCHQRHLQHLTPHLLVWCMPPGWRRQSEWHSSWSPCARWYATAGWACTVIKQRGRDSGKRSKSWRTASCDVSGHTIQAMSYGLVQCFRHGPSRTSTRPWPRPSHQHLSLPEHHRRGCRQGLQGCSAAGLRLCWRWRTPAGVRRGLWWPAGRCPGQTHYPADEEAQSWGLARGARKLVGG